MKNSQTVMLQVRLILGQLARKLNSVNKFSTHHRNKVIILITVKYGVRDKWVPVTTAWRVLRLRMEERPPVWRVAANKLNKQSRTADKG